MTYHRGEREVQARAALSDRAAFSEGAVGDAIPDVAAEFLATQPLLVVGAADDRGDLWCSPVTGPPGFLRAREPRTLDVGATPHTGDPLAGVLGRAAPPVPVGALAIEPATRRRMRINGTASPRGGGLRIATEQVYANCPKYIQKREVLPASPWRAGPRDGGGAGDPARSQRLTGGQQDLLRRADTFFVATASDTGDTDASHRGGAPGFVRVHSPTLLSWPDYVGNAMFMTLGNLALNPRAGLLVPDWETGGLLWLTGRARVLWGEETGERTVEFAVEGVVDAVSGGLLSPGVPQYSKFNPPVGPAAVTGGVR
ncbi:pyridoxamine 5'-phosphate oxidase family protein [Nocardiopsis sp. NPDC058631]|uniref:pyridoxamine 5'-phosphate oxidase family protein n=1 Tax=Nocardiopsis sp. NPDC058631 TaxID=3346566 RepID=UPI003667B808